MLKKYHFIAIGGIGMSGLAKFEYMPGKIDEVAKQIIPTLKPGNVVVGLGAGTITALGKFIKEQTQMHVK